MNQPTPADVAAIAGHAPPAHPVQVDAKPEPDDDLPDHLLVVDDVEEILDMVGPRTGDAPSPKVTVHLAHNSHDLQRTLLRELLTWEGAEISFPTPEGRSPRALLKFHRSSPQLSVALDATAVGHRVDIDGQTRWALDEGLRP